MWNDGGLWLVSVRRRCFALCVPVPAFVLADTLRSLADLCALFLPRAGHPNYPAEILRALEALRRSAPREPLVDIEADDVRVCVRKIGNGGRQR